MNNGITTDEVTFAEPCLETFPLISRFKNGLAFLGALKEMKNLSEYFIFRNEDMGIFTNREHRGHTAVNGLQCL